MLKINYKGEMKIVRADVEKMDVVVPTQFAGTITTVSQNGDIIVVGEGNIVVAVPKDCRTICVKDIDKVKVHNEAGIEIQHMHK